MVAAPWSTSLSPLETMTSTSPSGAGPSQVCTGWVGLREGSRRPAQRERNWKEVRCGDSSLEQESPEPSRQGGRGAGRCCGRGQEAGRRVQFVPRGPALVSWPFVWSARPRGFGHSDTVQASVAGSARTASHTLSLSLSAKQGTPLPSCMAELLRAGVGVGRVGLCLQLSHNSGLLKLDISLPYLISRWQKCIFCYRYSTFNILLI